MRFTSVLNTIRIFIGRANTEPRKKVHWGMFSTMLMPNVISVYVKRLIIWPIETFDCLVLYNYANGNMQFEYVYIIG